ncbi:MAG: hypothetical protein HY235_30730 [Acidobacteria bacterium]|nr:hypothetical protein [Acidobacteriota bacterium]
MVVWRQIWSPSDLDRETGLGDRLWEGDHELSRSASISSEPIEHPRVGIMVVRLPGTTVSGVGLPVRVDEPLRVLVVRVARVGVLERRLPKGQQQACYYAEME